MRAAGNFSPEWGYLAPVPSFMRMARVVMVATAVGATAGAGVVLSLTDHPVADGARPVIAAHAIVTSAQAAPSPVSASPVASAAPVSAPSVVQTRIPAAAPVQTTLQQQPALATQFAAPPSGVIAPPPGDVSTAAVPSVAALSEGSPATDAAPVLAPDDTSIMPPKKAKKNGVGPNGKNQGIGTVIRRMFTAHSGPSYYPSR